MGSIVSKKEGSPFEKLNYKSIMEKMKLLQDEIHEIKHLREMESRIHEEQEKITEWKEAEWKRERKKLREEVKRLRNEMAAKEEIIQGMEDGMVAGKNDKEWQWQLLESSFLVEHMREEQARRDEAVEKWKRLYIAIKTELDTIIQRAHQAKETRRAAMGSIVSKKERSPFDELNYKGIMEKMKLLHDEIHEIKHLREMECRIHEEQERITAWKEADWKQERKKLREEVKSLRKELTAKEETIRGMEDGMVAGKNEKEWQWQLLSNLLVEHMREEQARRDEAVEKWKRLYTAIKTELDTVIQRAHQGDRLYCGEEDNTIEALKKELKGKEETVQDLEDKVATMEKEGVKKEREADILRQSLRIVSSKNRGTHTTKGLIRIFRM